MAYLQISQDDLVAALDRPIIELADDLAMLACHAEIHLRRDSISNEGVTPNQYVSMISAAETLTLEKYGFAAQPHLVHSLNTPLAESPARLALKLAIAEARDEIPRHIQDEGNQPALRQLRRLFAYISPNQNTQKPHEKTRAFLLARLDVYQIALEKPDIDRAVDLAYHSHRAILPQQQNHAAMEMRGKN